jgi:hypothetical protein
MGSSLFWSCVAHLVSLHSSYSHRTPREGVRSLSGSIVASWASLGGRPSLSARQHLPTSSIACSSAQSLSVFQSAAVFAFPSRVVALSGVHAKMTTPWSEVAARLESFSQVMNHLT